MSQQRLVTSNNIDINEIQNFASQASQWWDPDGPFRPLHQINPIRLKYIRNQAIRNFKLEPTDLSPLRGLTCLDIGCGGGLISEPLARLGAEVTAIDPAEENIATAKTHASLSELDIKYHSLTAEQLAKTNRSFDLVVCLEVVEHVPNPLRLIRTISKLTSPDGLIIISTINRTLKSYALAILGAEYILRWLPVNTHRWEKFIRPHELQTFINQIGLRRLSTMGIIYNPVQDKWYLSKNTDVNYLTSIQKQERP
ncbi:MAG: Ubiquinone biosynthesis O-methyltransferase [Hyphomicrobiaceae bacterium hypho_1]